MVQNARQSKTYKMRHLSREGLIRVFRYSSPQQSLGASRGTWFSTSDEKSRDPARLERATLMREWFSTVVASISLIFNATIYYSHTCSETLLVIEAALFHGLTHDGTLNANWMNQRRKVICPDCSTNSLKSWTTEIPSEVLCRLSRRI